MSVAPVSRRQVLKAGAGAAAAAGVLGTSALAFVASPAGSASAASSGQAVMVRLRGEASGVLDLFVGTERLELHDAELAARIAAAARPLF